MATHSSILAWRIPWTEEHGMLWSMGSQRVGHDWMTFTSLHSCFCTSSLKIIKYWELFEGNHCGLAQITYRLFRPKWVLLCQESWFWFSFSKDPLLYLFTQPHPVGVIEIMCVQLSRFSRVQLFATPGTVAHQPPLSMVFSRQEYWSGLPFSPPGDLPDQNCVSCISYIGSQVLYH